MHTLVQIGKVARKALNAASTNETRRDAGFMFHVWVRIAQLVVLDAIAEDEVFR